MSLLPEHILPVSALAEALKSTLEGSFREISVVGEISNFTRAASGHCYFSLKDAKAQLRAVMFRGSANRLRFVPENGMEVICTGRVSFYVPRGDCQVVVNLMSPKGIGALQLAFEQLKEKLQKEGLFDEARKRPLPFLPRRVGVVTSASGAAIHDICRVIGQRFPNMSVLLYPVLVQGDGAPPQIVEGIQALNRRDDLDVLIVGRGGGSIEDLWAFNDEGVARAIAASRLPVISAVGHETDFTIADFVADVRAATPSQAAEFAVPEKRSLIETLRVQRNRLEQRLRRRLERHRALRDGSLNRGLIRDMSRDLEQRGQRVDDLEQRLLRWMELRRRDLRHRLNVGMQALRFQSPLARLQRGRQRHGDLQGRLARIRVMLLPQRRLAVTQCEQFVRNARPDRALREAQKSLARDQARLEGAMRRLLRAWQDRVAVKEEFIRSLNPDAILERGYSIVTKPRGRRLITNASRLKVGDQFRVKLARGAVTGEVVSVQEGLPLFDEPPSTDSTED